MSSEWLAQIRKDSRERDPLADVLSSARLFERACGPELTYAERESLAAFRSRHRGLLFLRGFASYTSEPHVIVLRPSQFTAAIAQAVVFPKDMLIPPDNSFISLAARPGPKPAYGPKPSGHIFGLPQVESWEKVSSPFGVLPPLFSRKELKEYVFEPWTFSSAMQELLLALYISSPPYRNLVGGFSSGLQSQGMRIVTQFSKYIHSTLPPELTTRAPFVAEIDGIRWSPFKPWRLEIGLDSTIEQLLLTRQDPLRSTEVSLATPIQAATAGLPDVPILLPDHGFSGKYPRNIQLPVAKYVVQSFYIRPELAPEVEEKTTSFLEERLKGLAERFETEYQIHGKHGLLDLNWDGKPLATLRLAQSYARSLGHAHVTLDDAKRQVDAGLLPVLTEYMDIAFGREEVMRRGGIDRMPERHVRDIFLAIIRLRNSCASVLLGPTEEEIARESGISGPKLADALGKLVQEPLVYQPRLGHYKPLPGSE